MLVRTSTVYGACSRQFEFPVWLLLSPFHSVPLWNVGSLYLQTFALIVPNRTLFRGSTPGALGSCWFDGQVLCSAAIHGLAFWASDEFRPRGSLCAKINAELGL